MSLIYIGIQPNIGLHPNTERRDIMKQERNIVLTTSCLQALSRLEKQESAVLWHLALMLPIVGEVVSNAGLGRELSIDISDITRVMKHLRELGFLMRGAKIGVSYHYKLNPAFFRIISL